jgi:hypothetical protein
MADDTADYIQVLAGIKERCPAARPIHPLGVDYSLLVFFFTSRDDSDDNN